MEMCDCTGVAYIINGVLYVPKHYIDGDCRTPVEYAPIEFDAFEYAYSYNDDVTTILNKQPNLIQPY